MPTKQSSTSPRRSTISKLNWPSLTSAASFSKIWTRRRTSRPTTVAKRERDRPGLPLLRGELLDRREVLEHDHGAERSGLVRRHRIGGDFERELAERQLDLGPVDRLPAHERLV